MSSFMEALKRAYISGRITVATVDSLKEFNKITEAEYVYITT